MRLLCLTIFITSLCLSALNAPARTLNAEIPQWTPYAEWTLLNPSHEGNPHDLVATATFTHQPTGTIITTPMFHEGGSKWKLRFTGTIPGVWNLSTKSEDPDLDGHTGAVKVLPNPGAHGFITNANGKWARHKGADQIEAFLPQYVMYAHPGEFHQKPEAMGNAIKTFIQDHGFTGFHVPVYCRWFDIHQERSDKINSPNPDPRTFEALEMIITKVHAAGGAVHLWAWGDESRKQTPVRWGISGEADQRLQRYIAARLGPLPGWTMGYGFDLDEWVKKDQIAAWRNNMHEHFGWPHMLGGRHGDPNQGLDHAMARSWNQRLDYASYEHHRPTYEVYAAARASIPGKPVFSEDRFRIRQSDRYRSKDYNEEMTRRGLWHATLAGGVANIWGKLDGDMGINQGKGISLPYENLHWIKTWSTFFKGRFHLDAESSKIGETLRLHSGSKSESIFYRENTQSITMDTTGIKTLLFAIAVDTQAPYNEIDLGVFPPGPHTWEAPHKSDWAVFFYPEPDQRSLLGLDR